MKESNITICGHGSGNPSLKRMDQYLTQRYNGIAPNGKHKGIVAVRRLKALTDADRKRFVEKYKTILGRNIYSQERRGYVYSKYSDGKYYSDCSSSGIATFKQLGYKFSWLYNTAAIYTQKEFEDVPVKIQNGHITNPEVLKVGDCLLFVGTDPSRPKQIGHVEYVYKIDGNGGEVKAKKDNGKYALPTLKKGSKGEEVKKLQNHLNRLGFKDRNGKSLQTDGDFGVKTEYALRAFQKKYKLYVDGIYGQKSYAAMKKALG